MLMGTLSLVQNGHIVFTIYSIFCIRKDNVPTTIYPYSTTLIGLTFLHQRQCPHHHIQLFNCIHSFDLFVPKTMSSPTYTTIPPHPPHPLVRPFCTKDNVPTTIYHYSTPSTTSTASIAFTAYCIHCVLCCVWGCFTFLH